MSQVYVNLDEVVPDDKIIKLKGREFIIPSDLSVECMLNVIKHSKSLIDNPNDIEGFDKAFKSLHDIFLIKNDNLSFEEFKQIVTIKQFAKIINIIFADMGDEKKNQEESEGPSEIKE